MELPPRTCGPSSWARSSPGCALTARTRSSSSSASSSPPIEYIARASPTLRDTFHRLSRYMALLNDRMVASFHEDAATGTFTYCVPGEPLSYGRHANEFGLALFVHGGRQLTEQPWNPLAVTFAHPAPPDSAPLTAFQDAVDAVRCELALPYLRDPHLGVSAVDRKDSSRVPRLNPGAFRQEIGASGQEILPEFP